METVDGDQWLVVSFADGGVEGKAGIFELFDCGTNRSRARPGLVETQMQICMGAIPSSGSKSNPANAAAAPHEPTQGPSTTFAFAHSARDANEV